MFPNRKVIKVKCVISVTHLLLIVMGETEETSHRPSPNLGLHLKIKEIDILCE